ncbi:MAG: D-glycero-beta-D-manno-heptose-7-phosphate kinase [Bauldia sp.]|nr:D-glycero-beta-D-manno-heptose-7-phosphate kinase [Bauldia sp.]
MDASVIDRLAQARVVVGGDVLLDRFVEGKVGRVSPEAPVAVLNHRAERLLLGGAGNVAANLVAFGAQAVLIGVAGDDTAADDIRTLCASVDALDCQLITDPSRPTTVKTRYLSGWHQLLRVDSEDASPLAAAVAASVIAAVEAALDGAGALILSDYAKGVLDAATIPALIALARGRGIPVIVDPKKASADVFAGATLLTPNADEMARFAGMVVASDAEAEAAGRKVLDAVSIEAILVTRGDRGMTLCRRGEPVLHVPAETHRVFDVTGAGDTVVAALAAALAAGLVLPEAVRVANAAAGVAVTKPGTATVSPTELKQALGIAGAANVMTPADARDQVEAWHRQGLRVGFTNGCFDLLHRGHLHSLDQAARRVDRLVVGVNSDDSARRLKGAGRPVQDLDTRAAVLAALKPVDLVVPFDEDTPAALIEAIAPDTLFKGADYTEAEVVGGDFVKARGGRVELLPLLPGHSTTSTLARLSGRS